MGNNGGHSKQLLQWKGEEVFAVHCICITDDRFRCSHCGNKANSIIITRITKSNVLRRSLQLKVKIIVELNINQWETTQNNRTEMSKTTFFAPEEGGTSKIDRKSYGIICDYICCQQNCNWCKFSDYFWFAWQIRWLTYWNRKRTHQKYLWVLCGHWMITVVVVCGRCRSHCCCCCNHDSAADVTATIIFQ